MIGNFYLKLVTFLVFLQLAFSQDDYYVPSSVRKLMTRDERIKFFNTGGSDVLDYATITIEWPKYHQNESDNKTISISINLYDQDIHLNLTRSTFLFGPKTPIYFFENSYVLFNWKEYPFYESSVDIYEDEMNLASWIVTTDSRGIKHLNIGTIGTKNITFVPIPNYLLERVNNPSISLERHNKHYFIVVTDNNQLKNFYSPLNRTLVNWIYNWTQSSPDNYKKFSRGLNVNNVTVKRPYVVYTEILVILDYSYLSKFNEQRSMNDYLLSFWNQVNIIFKGLRRPKHRLSIAGFVVAKDAMVFDFIKKNSIHSGSSEKLNYGKVLESAEKWLYKMQDLIPLDSYDVAIIQTLKPSSKITHDCYVTNADRGLAELRSVCHVNHYKEVVKKVGIIYDDCWYDGITAAARELAHILGVEDDNSEMCGNGFLMSPGEENLALNKFRWSPCSLYDFEDFLGTNPRCLYNIPKQYAERLQLFNKFNVLNEGINIEEDNKIIKKTKKRRLKNGLILSKIDDDSRMAIRNSTQLSKLKYLLHWLKYGQNP